MKRNQTAPKFKVSPNVDEHLNLVVGGGKLLEHKIICNGVEMKAVIDTDAFISAIDESIVDQCKWEINGPPLNLVGANGARLCTKGTVGLNIELQAGNSIKRKKHTFAIVRDLTAPILVGLELMKD